MCLRPFRWCLDWQIATRLAPLLWPYCLFLAILLSFSARALPPAFIAAAHLSPLGVCVCDVIPEGLFEGGTGGLLVTKVHGTTIRTSGRCSKTLGTHVGNLGKGRQNTDHRTTVMGPLGCHYPVIIRILSFATMFVQHLRHRQRHFLHRLHHIHRHILHHHQCHSQRQVCVLACCYARASP